MDEKNLVKCSSFSIDKEIEKMNEKELISIKNELIQDIVKTNCFNEIESNPSNNWKEDCLGCNQNIYSLRLVPIDDLSSTNALLNKPFNVLTFAFNKDSVNFTYAILTIFQ